MRDADDPLAMTRRSVRARTLVLLRWMAVGGQSATVLFVQFFLGFDVELAACLAVIAASAWLNTFLSVATTGQRFVRDAEAAGQLAYDICQLAVLVALTGGLDNPFVVLLGVPVMIASTALRPAWVLGLAGLALAAAGACLPDGARMLDTGLERVAIEVQTQILPDGGHVSRSPEAAVETLADLYALDDAVHARGWETPNAIRRAIDRLAPMVRFFMVSDGGLASFHGGGEGDRGLIEALLACDEAGGRTFEFAPHSGYHRVSVNGATLVLDVSGPPPGVFAVDAHASCLAFEFTPPGGRLIVNCGWSAGQPERFREPVRATAAHSTLVLEDTSSMRLIQPGLKRDLLGARLSSGPGRIAARRSEEEQGVWIEGSHEGYRAEFGLVHRRRIYIANAGGDVRGEDTLFRPVEDAAKDLSPDADGAYSYAIRFHLAPGVKPDVSRDRRSALLTLRRGECWRFRTDAGPIDVEPSIYLASSGRPREIRQLILRGVARLSGSLERPPNRVRWALQKLGRAPDA